MNTGFCESLNYNKLLSASPFPYFIECFLYKKTKSINTKLLIFQSTVGVFLNDRKIPRGVEIPLQNNALIGLGTYPYGDYVWKFEESLTESSVRTPNPNDRMALILKISTDPLCNFCKKNVWEESIAKELRKTLMYRHVFRHHLAEEMKFDLFIKQLVNGIDDYFQCPSCAYSSKDYGYLSDHFAVTHAKGT